MVTAFTGCDCEAPSGKFTGKERNVESGPGDFLARYCSAPQSNANHSAAMLLLILGLACSLPIFAATTGSLSGKITRSDSTTTAGALIEVLENVSVVATANTDASGEFKLTGLKPGNYAVRFSLDGKLLGTTSAEIVAGETTVVRQDIGSPAREYIYLNDRLLVIEEPGCTFSISPGSQSFGPVGGTGTVTVTAPNGCTWTASSGLSWVTITSGASGNGNGTVTYSVASNSGAARSGSITVAGQNISISQSTCTYSISPLSQSFGPTGGTGTINVTADIGCTWSATTADIWITITSGASGTGPGMVNYTVATNSGGGRTGTITAAGNGFTVTEGAAGCTYSLSITSLNIGSAGGSGSVNLTTGAGCTWGASSSVGWINITSAASGTGSATITFSVQANSATSSRSGTLNIGGQTLTINQDPASCAFTLSPASSQTVPQTGGPFSVSVMANGSNCSWTAVSNAAWITISAGASGTGNGTVSYSVANNGGTSTRTGTMTVAGQTFTVTQLGPCNYSISPTSQSGDASAFAGNTGVTAGSGCTWTATSNASWITVTGGSSGSGNGTVNYTVAANTTGSSRSGTATIAGQTFTYNQSASGGTNCATALSYTSTTVLPAGVSGQSVFVYAPSSCTWSAVSTVPWITIVAGSPSTGGAQLFYNVAGSHTPSNRIGSIVVGSLTLTITQLAGTCAYTISPTGQSFSYGASSGNTVNVTPTDSACNWTATSNAAWITVTAGSSGTGSGSVTYSVAANSSAGSRTGTLTIAGQTFTVTQAGVPCTYSISPTAQAVGSGAGTGSINLTTDAACSWTATSNAQWITLSGTTSGAGNATINYSFTVNGGSSSRSGTLTIAGQTFTLTQAGAPCTYSISPTSQSFGSDGGSGTVGVTATSGCSWTATSNASWITISQGASGSGNGTVTYSVATNASASARTGTLTVAGQTFTVTQAGIACTYTLSPTTQPFTSAAGTGSLAVTTSAGCSWAAATTAAWVTITSGASGSGNGIVNYSVAANTDVALRIGILTIGGQNFTLRQAGKMRIYDFRPGTGQWLIDKNGNEILDAGETVAFGQNGDVPMAGDWNRDGRTKIGVFRPSVGQWFIDRNGNEILDAGETVTLGQAGDIPLAGDWNGDGKTKPGLFRPSIGQWLLDINGNEVIDSGEMIDWGQAGDVPVIGDWNGDGRMKIGVFRPSTGQWLIDKNGNLVLDAGETIAWGQSGDSATAGDWNGDGKTKIGVFRPTTGQWLIDSNGNGVMDVGETIGFGQAGDIPVQADWNGDGRTEIAVFRPGVGQWLIDKNGSGTLDAGETVGWGQAGDIPVLGNTPANASCSYSISPTSQALSSAAGSGAVAVTAGPSCGWTATSNNSWLTINSGASGTGNGSVNYSVTANTAVTSRTGTLTIAGQTFTVSQVSSCTYSISPTSQSVGSDATSGSITLTAGAGCSWTAISNAAWITVTSGASGSGNGTINYSVAANPDPSARTGTVTIADQTFTVNQAPNCANSISPTNQSISGDGGSGTVSVTAIAACSWTATSNASWITVTGGASGSGNGTVNYSVAANPDILTRTGTVSIGGQTLTVSQGGGTCTYSVTPTDQSFASDAATGTETVTATSGCPWAVTSNASWITITSGASGTGNGSFGYSVAVNPDVTSRAGTVAIAGRTFTVTQAGTACSYSISPTTASFTSAAGTGSTAVTATAGCFWSAASSASWITITAGASGTGNGTVSYSVATNTTTSSRAGTIMIAGQNLTITQAAASCTYSLSPPSQSFTSAAGTGSVGITAVAGCGWSAVSNASWITVSAGATGSGNGTVSYSVAANTGSSSRTSTLTIASQAFNITQASPCSYSISPTSQSLASGGGTGSVVVTATAGCPWTAASNDPWLSITSGGSGTGNGTVNYSATANSATASRNGTLTIAGQTFTVTEAGISCSFSISPTSQSIGAGVTTGTVTVTATSGCGWTAVSNASWITVTSGTSGNGNGTVSYSAAANNSTSSRSGTVTIAGQTFTLSQASAICSFSIAPISRTFTSSGGTGSVAVSAPTGCGWSATSNASWINITSGSSGNGNGTVAYSVNNTNSKNSRTGTMTIAGQTFTVTQGGTGCNYSIAPTSASFTSAAGTGSINVTSASGCGWSAASNVSWASITAGASGTANGTVSYSVQANSDVNSRSGALTVAGQTFTITQGAVGCSYSISPTSLSFDSSGGFGSVAVTAGTSCGWSAASNASWITVTSGASGSGNGSVAISVAASSTSSSRSGTVTIAGQTFTATQNGAACTFSISPVSQSIGSGGGTGSVTVTSPTGCSWTATSNDAWIAITGGGSGSGNGTVSYSASTNGSILDRSGTLTIAGQTFSLTQAGAVCSYSISPTAQSFSSSAGTGSVSVASSSGCSWAAVSNASWITVTGGASGSGNGTVSYSVAANTDVSPRAGTVTIGGQNFTVTQAAAGCSFSISPSNQSFNSGSGAGTLAVTATSGCSWSAASNASWITITAGGSGTGNGSVSFSVAANTGTASRAGTITAVGQTFTLTQAGAACTYSLAPTSQSVGSGSASGSVGVTSGGGCGWIAVSNATWLSVTSGATGSGNGSVGYSVAANPDAMSRTGTLTIAGQSFSVTQAAATCSFSISPTSQTFTQAAAVGGITVSSPNGCSWIATSNVSWISVTGGASGTGNGSVSYSVQANSDVNSRNGTISVAGQTFTATQAGVGCTFAIAPTSQSFSSAAGSGSLSMTAGATCPWMAASNDAWITVTGGATGTGNGTVSYSVAANGSTTSRTGTMTIGGQTFTANQASTCTYSISPTTQSFTDMGGSGSVAVMTQAGCAWTAVSNAAWTTVTAGASGGGNGTVNYSVAANTGVSRTTTIAIAGQTFTVTQAAPCTFSISPTSQSFSSAAGAGSVTVTTQTGCSWTAAPVDNWLGITSGASGTGNGTVNYSVAGNTGAARTGTMTIGGQTFTVTQAAPCTFSISPTGQSFSSAAGTGSVAVTTQTGCAWTAAPVDNWLSITSGASGIGNGTVNYSVTANSGPNSRTGTMTIAGQTFTVTQSAPCTYSISPTSQSFSSAAGTGSVTVTTQAGCSWTAAPVDNWLSITSGTSGTASGTVSYSVASNTGSSRTGTMTIAGQTFMVTQASASWYGTWTNRKRITIDHTKVAGTSSLTDFAVLYSVTDPNLKTVANGGSVGKADGTDLLFTAGDGITKLNHEIETYNGGTGQLIAWVNAPSLSPSTDTILYIYYGNAAAADQQNRVGVWDTSYKGVWHLGNGVGLSTNDSTSIANDLTNSNATAASGKIDGAASFNGTNAALRKNAPVTTVTDNYTLEAWINPSSLGVLGIAVQNGDDNGSSGSGYGFGIGNGSGGAGSKLQGINSGIAWLDSGYTFSSAGTWYHVVMERASGITKFYVNGSQTANTQGIAPSAPVNGFDIGSQGSIRWFPGIIDEVRVSSVVRSADWIATEYNNQISSSLFYSVGQQESLSGGCTYSISPISQSFSSAAGTGSVTITTQAGCSWTAAPVDNWLSITSGTSGAGNGTVNYSVATNTGAARTGTMTIAGQTFTVTQSGTCTFSISPTNQSFSAAAGTGNVTVTSQAGCSWTATTSSGWITITAGASGSGNGTVSYSTTANSTVFDRMGTMTIAGQTFTVTQSGLSQFARPVSDTGSDNWSAVGSALLYDRVSENPPDDDVTYDQSTTSPWGHWFEVKLRPIDPPGAGTVTYRFRARKQADVSPGEDGIPAGLIVELRQGASIIAEFRGDATGPGSSAPLSAAYQTFNRDLTQAERNSITDWTNLRIRVWAYTGTGPNSGASMRLRCTWLELQTPSIAAGSVARPALDIATQGYNPDNQLGGLIYPRLNEITADDDLSYAYSDTAPWGYPLEVKVAGISTAGTGTVTIRVRHRKQADSGGDSGVDAGIVIELRQGTTVIATRRGTCTAPANSVCSLSNYSTESFDLTTAERNSITDWNDLRVRVWAYTGTGPNSTSMRVRISWIELSIH